MAGDQARQEDLQLVLAGTDTVIQRLSIQPDPSRVGRPDVSDAEFGVPGLSDIFTAMRV